MQNLSRQKPLTLRYFYCKCGDECDIAMASGMHGGIGKVGHVDHILADTYGYDACKDPELVNGHVAQARGTDQGSEVADGVGDSKDYIR